MRRRSFLLSILLFAFACAAKSPEKGSPLPNAATVVSGGRHTPPEAGAPVASADAAAREAPPQDAGTPATGSTRPLVLAEVLALRPEERTCVIARESSGTNWTEVAFEDARGDLRRIVHLGQDEKTVGWMQVLHYDSRGNVMRIEGIDAAGKSTLRQEFSFDADGVLRHFIGSGGVRHHVEYGKPPRAGEVQVRAERLPWRWIHDVVVQDTPDRLPTTGFVAIFDEPDKTGFVMELRYDARGWLAERVMYLGGAVVRGAPPSTHTTYVRDGRGRLLEARMKNNETSQRFRETYSWKGDRLVRVSSGGAAETREMDYDAAGRLTRARIKSGKDILSETLFDHACPAR